MKFINEIYELPEKKVILLKDNKKIIKLNLKDYTFSLLVDKEHNNFSILNSKYFCLSLEMNSYKICFYDLVINFYFKKKT